MDLYSPDGDQPEDPRLDALLDGVPADHVEPALAPLKRLLDAAAAPGSPEEQNVGLIAALRAHGEATGPVASAARQTKQHRRKAWTVGAAAAALVLVGTTSGAYAGVLPAPLQDFAHSTIGAPSAAEAAADDASNPSLPADATPFPVPGTAGPLGGTLAPGAGERPGAVPKPGANPNGNPGGNSSSNGGGNAKPKPTPAPNGNANGVGKPKPTPTQAPNGNANGVGKPKPTPTPKGNANGVGSSNSNGSRP